MEHRSEADEHRGHVAAATAAYDVLLGSRRRPGCRTPATSSIRSISSTRAQTALRGRVAEPRQPDVLLQYLSWPHEVVPRQTRLRMHAAPAELHRSY